MVSNDVVFRLLVCSRGVFFHPAETVIVIDALDECLTRLAHVAP